MVIVAGKGGVGKTVVSAALARAAASTGRDVLIAAVDGRSSVAASFDAPPFGYDDVTLLPPGITPRHGAVRARTIAPDRALIDYLSDHGLRRIAGRMASLGVLDIVSTATPGIRDLLVLGKVKQLAQGNSDQMIVLDAPAAGHAFTFLDAPRVLHETARAGPIHQQATEVLALLRDPSRVQVMLVTLAEETPINELVETAYRLEDQVGVALGPVVVNGLLPRFDDIDRDPIDCGGAGLGATALTTLREVGRWWSVRQQRQLEQIERLREALPLPQIHLQHSFTPRIDAVASARLAAELALEVESLEP